jgi:hypothetical protein
MHAEKTTQQNMNIENQQPDGKRSPFSQSFINSLAKDLEDI